MLRLINIMIVAAGLLLPQFALGQSHELKVMSYNIRLSTGNDGTNAWMYRCPATLEMLKDQQPDVFGVQEALEDQIMFLEEFADGYDCVGLCLAPVVEGLVGVGCEGYLAGALHACIQVLEFRGRRL